MAGRYSMREEEGGRLWYRWHGRHRQGIWRCTAGGRQRYANCQPNQRAGGRRVVYARVAGRVGQGRVTGERRRYGEEVGSYSRLQHGGRTQKRP